MSYNVYRYKVFIGVAMSDNMTIGPAGVGLGGAIIGGAFGFLGAPYKYDLQQIITLDEPAFKQVFTSDVFLKSKGFKKDALDKIVNAREVLIKGKTNGASTVKLGELLANPELLKAYNSVKEFIPKARGYSALAGAFILGLLTTGVSFLFFDSAKPKS